MDHTEAAKQLAAADTLQERMRHNARHCAFAAVTLGVVTLVGTALLGASHGGTALDIPVTLVVLGAAVAAGAYAWSRPTLPRNYLTMHLVMTVGGIAVLHTVTSTVGRVVFPGEWLWWGPGAILSATPAFVVAYITLRRDGARSR
ncbi:hypothetical protein J4H86_14955 [Spiractinospora alimapuensis]|uniref:hypothetical protein n=1 Tax=Spiractinospora alimapuensis TaxID=2820884 RepID=UPI001F32986C|nr:hypothetical protein [Spiractinospora alimapuensis]QVQ50249.1 hypothetical protein J4H86_14955 [Spiractinospora alimapuensis]